MLFGRGAAAYEITSDRFLVQRVEGSAACGVFLQGLRELGYVEGKNIHIEYRYSEGRNDALPGLAAELVARQVLVILTTTPTSNRAVLKATSKIPIVSIGGGDVVSLGIAKTLAHPGGNLTGLSATAGRGMMGKRLEFLKEAFPKTVSVSYLWNPDAREVGSTSLDDAQKGATALGGFNSNPTTSKTSPIWIAPRTS